jgi:hypothetical protein
MSPERTQAYRRVVKALDDLGPSKLLDSEQDRVRTAADNLIFSSDLREDVVARQALEDVRDLCQGLIESGRWESVTAERLLADLEHTGPLAGTELKAA